MVKPFSPSEAKEQHIKQLPSAVIAIVNDFLAQRAGSNLIKITQKEVVDAVISQEGLTRGQIFDNHMLDFEDAFRKNGWEVVYDRPGYNESYEAFWVFRAK